MPRYIDTRGKSSAAIAVCGRCGEKFPIGELRPDPNSPGVRVCAEDLDALDPWRLSPRQVENISLEFPRPDLPLSPGPSLQAIPETIPWNIPFATEYGDVIITETGLIIVYAAGTAVISSLQPAVQWQSNTAYVVGQQIIPVAPGSISANLTRQFVCVAPGTSGTSAPVWPGTQGQTVVDNVIGNPAGSPLVWFTNGIYLP